MCNFRKIFIVLLFFFNLNIKPFVSYYLFKKDNNYIFMLGDIHSTDITEINSYHAQVFIQFISKYQFQAPIPFILESGFNNQHIEISESISQKINNNQARDITMRTLNKHFSKNKKEFDLINFDCRQSKTYILYLILEELDNFLANKIVTDQFDFEGFKAKITFSTNLLVGDYLNCLEINKQYFKNWLTQLNSKSLFFKEMNYLYEKNIARTEYIVELLAGVNQATKFDTFLVNTFANCTTIADANIKRKEIIYTLFHADLYFADIGFLQQLIEYQSKHSKTLLVAGQYHAMNISANLQQMGYKLITYKSANPHSEFIGNVCDALNSFLIA